MKQINPTGASLGTAPLPSPPAASRPWLGKASLSCRGFSPLPKGLGRRCITAAEEPGARMLACLPARGRSPAEGMQACSGGRSPRGRMQAGRGDAAWWEGCRWAGGDAAW